MMRRRAILGTFLSLVSLLVAGLMAMRFASVTLARVVFVVSLLVLLTGTLCLLVRPRQGFWVGFCLFGWFAALTALIPAMREAIVPYLPIHKPLDWVVEWIGPVNTKPSPLFLVFEASIPSPATRIGHEFLALGFALFGAMAGKALWGRVANTVAGASSRRGLEVPAEASAAIARSRETDSIRLRHRMGLGQLMAIVGVLAIGLGAMKDGSDAAARIGFALSLVILLLATLALILGKQTGAWIGFCLFGWFAALVGLVPAFREDVGPEMPIHEPLAQIVSWFHPVIPKPVNHFAFRVYVDDSSAASPASYFKLDRGDQGTRISLSADETAIWTKYQAGEEAHEAWRVAVLDSTRIGHEILALSFALSGAFAGRALDNRSTSADESPGAPDSSDGA